MSLFWDRSVYPVNGFCKITVSAFRAGSEPGKIPTLLADTAGDDFRIRRSRRYKRHLDEQFHPSKRLFPADPQFLERVGQPVQVRHELGRYLADKIYGFSAAGATFLPVTGDLPTVPKSYASEIRSPPGNGHPLLCFRIPGEVRYPGGVHGFSSGCVLPAHLVSPGQPAYDIGSPVFEEVRISLANGKTFTIMGKRASAANKYSQSARLNGQPLDRPWFEHSDIAGGGALTFERIRPNKDSEPREDAAPPSMSKEDYDSMSRAQRFRLAVGFLASVGTIATVAHAGSRMAGASRQSASCFRFRTRC